MNRNTTLRSGTAVVLGLTCFTHVQNSTAAGDLSVIDAATQENYYQWSTADAYSLSDPSAITDTPTSPSTATMPSATKTNIPNSSNASTYTVQPGETLFAVMRQSGRTLQELIQWNGLQPPYSIKAGQVLKLNGSATSTGNTSATPAKSGTAATYVVKPGDTLYEVMRQTGTSIKQLVKLNSLNQPYHVKAGQVLRTGK